MELTTRTIAACKHIALVAHDHRKQELLKWVESHKAILVKHLLYATGTTGNLIHQASGISVQSMLSGPMGSDQQIGTLIAEGKIDMLIFFQDPLNAGAARSRREGIAAAGDSVEYPSRDQSRSTADFLIDSSLFNGTVEIAIPDYRRHLQERLKQFL